MYVQNIYIYMIRVIRAKDLIKYLIRILIPIVIIMCMVKGISKLNAKSDNKNTAINNEQDKINEEKETPDSEGKKKSNKRALIECIKDNLPEIILENDSNEEETKTKKKKYAFLSELELMKNLKEDDNNMKPDDNNEENNQGNEEVVKARTDVTTEVVPNAVNPRSTNEYNGVKINNSTDYTLTEDMLTPDIEVNKNKVVIYHTHTCESYTATEQYNYVQSGNFRSTDLNFSVARVGDELDKQLTAYGVQVIHDKTYHDYPAYNGSYGRSLKTAESILANHGDADIVIDLHRDAIADETYAPKVKIGDEYASQLMFVMGSNVANSINENWNQNLKFAIKVMQKANELYPGLFKPLILRNSEYNQHVAKGACIIEVGSTGNTLEESMNSMKYLAKILSEI